MFAKSALLCLTSLLLASAQGLRVEESQEFPLGSEVENLALRPSGNALAVVYTFPRIYEVEPVDNAPLRLLHTFENTNGISSISESKTPDVYFVITGNFTWQSLTPGPVPGSYAIHRLSFDECDNAIVEELASLEKISQPNGMITVPNTPYVLIADAREGFIYRFNTDTLELTTYFDHPLLKPTQPQIVFGVNGLKFSGEYLYFSNTNQQLIARIKATGEEDSLSGEPEIVVPQTFVDDFIINDSNGDIYIAQLESGSLGFVSGEEYGSTPEVLLGGPDDPTVLEGPTSAIWAKDAVGQTLLVTVNGNFTQFFTGQYTGGGRVKIVHLEPEVPEYL